MMTTGIDICTKAREFIGYPYVYGGSSPVNGGFDCSGLVQYAYKVLGISIPRTTYDQIKIGTKITDKSKLLPGDLIFNFDSNGIPQHVMLYSGNNNVIEAQYEGTFIKEHSYWSWQGTAVRVIQSNVIPTPIQTPVKPIEVTEIYYRVICGSYRIKVNATARVTELKNKGFNSFIAEYNENGVIFYRVVVGSYKDKANAELQQKALSSKGFSSFILVFKK